VAAVVGGTSFEALWLRPSPADEAEETGAVVLIYASTLYVSVALNMYAVLIAILLLIAMLFYTGKNAAKRMLLKYHVIAGLPVVATTLGMPLLDSFA